MRNYSRFIPGEEIDAVEQWNFAAVDTASLLLAAQVKVRDEAAEESKQEACRQAGYAEGFAQGRAQATMEAQRQMADFIAHQGSDAARQFAQLFATVQAQLAEAEQVMAQGTLELACELARQVLRRELSVDPKAVQPVIREALGLLAADTKSAVVRLHPLDLNVLEEVVRTEFSSLSLTLLADPTLTRGGCLIESAGTVVDGTLEKRWMRAVASLGLDSSWEEPADEQ
ncbi:flagellar assembly protein FliH [Rhodoferax ferrireducens T118]|uniref:Flagellar assembly protein FliH n=1 Tax=Albidiferax ferrireducens (strain ATCC BAA-621 / DSM 15236 / T118) TaxID=338969 RepID=Q221K0_ALBFT|nr:flagellar assembly protein FliH [Rhodoferax ferrireducens]ABD68303.1 flagellar assembly protein FliH [Rhodoferax ferrireducens T118]